MYWHRWMGTNEDYDYVEASLGKARIKPVAGLWDYKVTTARVFDDRKKNWVLVRPGDVVCEDAGEVWVE